MTGVRIVSFGVVIMWATLGFGQAAAPNEPFPEAGLAALTLQSGDYELRIVIPSKRASKEEETLPVKVAADGEKLVIHSRAETEVPFQATGTVRNGKIEASWIVEEEDVHLKYVFEGEATLSTFAHGTLSYVVENEVTPYGKWLLSMTATADDPAQRRAERTALGYSHGEEVFLGEVDTQTSNRRSLCTSPDMKHMAYRRNVDGKSVVIANGVRGNQYDHVWNIKFGSQGTLGYFAWSGDSMFVVKDGKEGTRYRDIVLGQRLVSHNGKRFAYAAQKDAGWIIVIDGAESEEYEMVKPPVFSSETGKVVYAAQRGGKWFIVKEGEPSEELKFQLDKGSNIVLSPDGNRVAYVASRDRNQFVVVDSEPGKEYDKVGYLIFSSDARRFAYIAAKGPNRFVVCDGVEGKHFEGMLPGPAFSAKGLHFAYAALRQGKWRVVLDGDETGNAHDRIFPPGIVFSPDETHYVYTGEEYTGEPVLVRDGTAISLPYDSITTPVFSSDSRHIVYVARWGDTHLIIVDDSVVWEEYPKVLDSKVIFTGPATFRVVLWRGIERERRVKGEVVALEFTIED